MISLKNLQINKANELNSQLEAINKSFDDLVNEKLIKELVLKLSNITSIPKNTLNLEMKQFISSKFNYSEGKFENIFYLKKIFSSATNFLLRLLYIIIFSKPKSSQKSYDLLVDDITQNDLKILRGIAKEFKSHIFIGNQSLKTEFNYLKIESLKNFSRKLILKNLSNFLFLFFYLIQKSFKEKVNLIPIFSHIVFRFLKYQSIFEMNVAKYLVNVRPTIKSSIRNYLFKKNGGKFTASIQKSLNGFGYADFFYDTDILFSFGTRSFLINDKLSCNIKKIIPVGSLALEQYWHKEKKIESTKFDIVNLAGNSTNTPDILKHKEYDDDYYEQFEWMVKISKKFPQLYIGIKHHTSLRTHDKKEIKIIKNSSIKRVIHDDSNGKNQSYNVGYFSNFICTWCSIIAYELLSLNQPCFFLDPEGRNNSFFQNDEINDFWRIKSYEDFEKKVIEVVIEKKIINIKNPNYFCLDSANVSKKITNELHNFNL